MNNQIVNFFQQNKDKYTQDSLMQEMRNEGHSESDIKEAADVVFGVADDANIRYAGFWIRSIAQIIDMFIISIILLPFTFIFQGLIENSYLWSMILVPFGAFVVSLVYFIFMTDRYQATLGKKLFRLKVCDEQTLQKAPFINIVNREGISRVIIFVFIPIHLLVAFLAKKQGAHDLAAHTVVIHANNKK